MLHAHLPPATWTAAGCAVLHAATAWGASAPQQKLLRAAGDAAGASRCYGSCLHLHELNLY